MITNCNKCRFRKDNPDGTFKCLFFSAVGKEGKSGPKVKKGKFPKAYHPEDMESECWLYTGKTD
jgi:hypothetical protein